MQKNIYQWAVLSLGLLFGGCNLDLAPENVMVDQNVYKNETTAEAALLGAYVRLNSFFAGAPNDQNNYANVGYGCLLGDLGTNNLKAQTQSTSFLHVEEAEYTQDDHEGFIRAVWTSGYNAVDYANNVIAGVAKYGAYGANKMAQHIAEAKFLRGYEYFLLLQLFGDGALTGNANGLGLVIRTTPYDGYDPDEVQERTTVREAYELIIRDLTEAIRDLPDAVPGVTSRIRANKSVARALLSRVYLYRGTYGNVREDLQLAADLADTVLQNGAYSFNGSYEAYLKGLFPQNVEVEGAYPNPVLNNNEVLFFQPSGNSVENYSHGLTSYFNKASFYIEDASFYAANDLRGFGGLIGTGTSTNNASLNTSLKYSSGGGYNDVMYLRLSEVKLTYAEAVTRLSNSVRADAVGHLNDIRRRPFTEENKPAAYTTASFSGANDLIDEILLERRRELAYEGHYRWDLIRTGRALRNVELPDNRKNFPVPQYEITISGGVIQQNSGF